MSSAFQRLFKIYDEECRVQLKESLSQTTLDHLSYNHYIYLNIINRLGQPTLGEIADELNITKPSVTGMINKLVKENLVHKLQSEYDKRVYNVELSELGHIVVGIEENAFIDVTGRLMKELNEQEQKELEVLLNKGLKND